MEKKVTPAELARLLAASRHITYKQAEAFVRLLFEIIGEALLRERFVRVKGFGTFKLIGVSERESVNINTGERFSIDGHDKVTFTPDAVLRDLVNLPFSHFQTIPIAPDTDISAFETIDTAIEAEEAAADEADVANAAVLEEQVKEEDEPAEEALPVPEVPSEKAEVPSAVPEEEMPEPAEEVRPTELDAVSEVSEEESVPSDSPLEDPAPLLETSEEEKVTEEQTTEGQTTEEHVVGEEPAPQDYDEPQPLAELTPIEMEMNKKEHALRAWKTVAIVLIVLILMTISYFAGHVHLFGDICFDTPSTVAPPPAATPAPPIAAPVVLPADSAVLASDTLLAPVPDSLAPSAMPIKTVTVPTQSVAAMPGQGFAQVENGKYIIVGTRAKHTIAQGETLRSIAEEIYGSKGYAPYIIVYNNIFDPNNVKAGTTINLPELIRRQP